MQKQISKYAIDYCKAGMERGIMDAKLHERKDSNMNKTTRTAALGAATALAMAAAPPAASADYQYIISGDPVAAATAGVTSVESAARSLEVRQLAAAGSLTKPLDVRQHATAESGTTALNSQKLSAFTIIVR